MTRLTEKDLKKKVKFHDNRAEFYDKKLKSLKEDKKRIGFRFKKENGR